MSKVIVAGTQEMAEALARIHPEVEERIVGRATPEQVEGKYVIGSLPPHLAERAAVVEAPAFAFSPEDRGKTLSPDEILARYRGSSATVTFGERDLQQAEGLRDRGGVYEHLADAYQRAKEGADLLVTRHEGLKEFLREYGVVSPDTAVREHISSPDEVRGKVVAGILPPHLAREATAVISPPPVDAGRGQELSREEMEAALAAKGITPPGTQVAVIRSLDDKEFQRLMQETPRVDEPQTPLEAKVESIKAFIQVEVDAQKAREALEALGAHLERMVHDGHHGYPSPSFQKMEEVLTRALKEGEGTGSARVSLADLQAFEEALGRYPRESVLEGANAWAATPPEELVRFAREVREAFGPKEADLEIG